MRDKKLITFVIFAYNEAHRIQYPIKNFLPYGDVVVWDNMSTDETPEIAKKLGATVIRKHRPEDYAEHDNTFRYVKTHIKTPWIFWAYADEMVPMSCLEKYQEIAQGNYYKIVVQKRKTMMFDYHHEYVPTYVCIKFFRLDSLDFKKHSIHQMGQFASHVKPHELCYLPPIDEYSVYHFSTHSTKNIINSFNLYAGSHASARLIRFVQLKMLLIPWLTFLQIYFFDGAFKFGIEGFMISVQYAYYPFLIYSLAYEQSRKKTSTSIEKNFTIKKKELLHGNPRTSFLWKPIAIMKIKLVAYLYTKKRFTQSQNSKRKSQKYKWK